MFLDLLANSKTYKKKIYEKLENDVVYELEKDYLQKIKRGLIDNDTFRVYLLENKRYNKSI